MLGVAPLNCRPRKHGTIIWNRVSSSPTRWNIGTSGLDDRYLEFRLPLRCGNVGSVATELPDPENIMIWNCVASSFTSWNLGTSGLDDRHLEFQLPVIANVVNNKVCLYIDACEHKMAHKWLISPFTLSVLKIAANFRFGVCEMKQRSLVNTGDISP